MLRPLPRWGSGREHLMVGCSLRQHRVQHLARTRAEVPSCIRGCWGSGRTVRLSSAARGQDQTRASSSPIVVVCNSVISGSAGVRMQRPQRQVRFKNGRTLLGRLSLAHLEQGVVAGPCAPPLRWLPVGPKDSCRGGPRIGGSGRYRTARACGRLAQASAAHVCSRGTIRSHANVMRSGPCGCSPPMARLTSRAAELYLLTACRWRAWACRIWL